MDNNLLEEAEKMKKRTKQNEFFIDNNILLKRKMKQTKKEKNRHFTELYRKIDRYFRIPERKISIVK